MKKMNVRLPDTMLAEIEAESRERGISKAEVVRERLQRGEAPIGPASGAGENARGRHEAKRNAGRGL